MMKMFKVLNFCYLDPLASLMADFEDGFLAKNID
jgi:hypothetical protein